MADFHPTAKIFSERMHNSAAVTSSAHIASVFLCSRVKQEAVASCVITFRFETLMRHIALGKDDVYPNFILFAVIALLTALLLGQ